MTDAQRAIDRARDQRANASVLTAEMRDRLDEERRRYENECHSLRRKARIRLADIRGDYRQKRQKVEVEHRARVNAILGLQEGR